MGSAVVFLSSRKAADVALTGGKGASLARLHRHSFPVPPGFVITTRALRPPLESALRLVGGDGLDAAHAYCLAWEMPGTLRRAVLGAYGRLGHGPVAVRSSLVCEDSASASCAGLLDTVLGAQGEPALLAAVRRILASAFNQRLWAYLGKGGIALQAHYRDFDDYRSPQGDVFNSGATDQGFLARGEYEIGKGLLGASWQSDFGSDIGRPRNNSTTVRFYYPVEDSHRFTSTYDLRQVGGFERVTINTFVGRYRQVTDQDRYATATRGRTLEEADYEADDFQVRASAERLFSTARFEVGVDLNGRFNVHATDTVTSYGLDGNVTSEVFSESIGEARRNDTGASASVEAAMHSKATVAAGIRGDYMTSHNSGGYFGDHETSNGAFSGSGSLTVGPWAGVSFVAQAGTGFRDPTVSDRYYRSERALDCRRAHSLRATVSGVKPRQPEA